MTGCPKANQLHKIIPIMLDYHWQKHNPDKIFKMDCRKGAPYPYYNIDKVHNENLMKWMNLQSNLKVTTLIYLRKPIKNKQNSIQQLVV